MEGATVVSPASSYHVVSAVAQVTALQIVVVVIPPARSSKVIL